METTLASVAWRQSHLSFVCSAPRWTASAASVAITRWKKKVPDCQVSRLVPNPVAWKFDPFHPSGRILTAISSTTTVSSWWRRSRLRYCVKVTRSPSGIERCLSPSNQKSEIHNKVFINYREQKMMHCWLLHIRTYDCSCCSTHPVSEMIETEQKSHDYSTGLTCNCIYIITLQLNK